MKAKLVCLLVMTFCALNTKAQSFEQEIDDAKKLINVDKEAALIKFESILTQLVTENDRSLFFEAFYGLINTHYHHFDYHTAYHLADSLIRLQPPERFIMLAQERKGDFHWYGGKFDSAAHYYTIVKDLALKIGDSIKLGTAFRDLGDYYRQTGNYEQAKLHFDQSIQTLTLLKDSTILPSVYNNYSIVFANLGEIHHELYYLLKALEMKERGHEYASIALYKKNIADIYISLNEFEKAYSIIQESLQQIKKAPSLRYETYIYPTAGRIYHELGKLDSAAYYYEKALAKSLKLGEKRYQARIYKSLGDLAWDQENPLTAEKYYYTSLSYFSQIKDPINEVKALLGLARVNLQKKAYDQSTSFLFDAEKLASKNGNKPELFQCFTLLSECYEKMKRIDMAYLYLKKSDSIEDILFNEDRAKFIAVNEILHQTKNQQLENSQLKENIANQEDRFGKQSAQLRLVLIIIFGIFIIAIILFYAYRKAQQNKQRIAEKNRELEAKNREVEHANQQQIDLIHLVAHDLKAPMNKIQGLISIMKLRDNLDNEDLDIINRMENISAESKGFIVSLLEAQDLERKALEPKMTDLILQEIIADPLEELKTNSKNKEQSINYIDLTEDDICIYADKELFQHMLLNLFSNAVKFSPKGSTVTVKLMKEDKYIALHIIDEGPGFSAYDKGKMFTKFQKLSAEPTANESSSGLGLYLIKILAEKMGIQVSLLETLHGAHFVLKIEVVRTLTDKVHERTS